MGFFSGIFDFFVGVGIGILTFIGVPALGGPTCTIDLSGEQLSWSVTESTDVTISALTDSPAVPGASQTLDDPKPFSGSLNSLFSSNPQPILTELRNNGVSNASFDPNKSGLIDGFNQTQTVANRICEVYFPGSKNTKYSTKNYKTPKNNTILDFNGSSWTQRPASEYPGKGRHIDRDATFTCERDVAIPPLSGTHDFKPALGVGTHIYNLVAQGPKGTKTCEASVTITDENIDPDTDTGTETNNDEPDIDSGPQCSDGVDNDGDGLVDYPNDPGCSSVNDTTEAPNPECSDGIDNNGDGLIDYPEDPACSFENDFTEDEIPEASLSLIAEPSLVRPETATTLTWSATNIVSGSCILADPQGGFLVNLLGNGGAIETDPISSETTFTLTCLNLLDLSLSEEVTVRLVPSFQEF